VFREVGSPVASDYKQHETRNVFPYDNQSPVISKISPTTRAVVALVLGLLLGVLVRAARNPALDAIAGALQPLGTLWVNAVRMTLVPLVVSLLIASVTGAADLRVVGRMGARALALFLALLVGAAVLAALVLPPLFARMPLAPEAAAALRATTGAAPAPAGEVPTVAGWITSLVPVNPVQAAAEGAMLPLVVFALLFAVAATRTAPASREAVLRLFRAVADAMLVVVGWVLALAPIGVFALALGMGRELGLAAAGAVGYYVLVLCAALAAATLLLYPVAAVGGRTTMRRFARAAAPAQAVAVSTRSSIASLPALIEGARDTLGDRPAVTGFVLPLAVSTFKINTPIADLAGPLFIAQLYGVPLGPAQIATMAALSVAMSFSNPGIPSGGMFAVTAPVLLSVGLPVEGIGLLIAADAIPDVFNTVINVTGDMTVATVLSRDDA
jgi:Na+/H+-dicarboxylate symporter